MVGDLGAEVGEEIGAVDFEEGRGKGGSRLSRGWVGQVKRDRERTDLLLLFDEECFEL